MGSHKKSVQTQSPLWCLCLTRVWPPFSLISLRWFTLLHLPLSARSQCELSEAPEWCAWCRDISATHLSYIQSDRDSQLLAAYLIPIFTQAMLFFFFYFFSRQLSYNKKTCHLLFISKASFYVTNKSYCLQKSENDSLTRSLQGKNWHF